MPEWTDAQEISGRRAFDCWRFSEVDRPIPWDWADMGAREKRLWVERATHAGRIAAGADQSRASRGSAVPS